jgi:hypothetical protein
VCATGSSSGNSGEAAESATPSITSPDGSSHPLTFDTEGNDQVVRWKDTVSPGVYTIKIPGAPNRLFSVFPPAKEAQLASYDDATRELAEDATGAIFVPNKTELNNRIAEESGLQEWWRRLVIAALILACLELAIGRVFSS